MAIQQRRRPRRKNTFARNAFLIILCMLAGIGVLCALAYKHEIKAWVSEHSQTSSAIITEPEDSLLLTVIPESVTSEIINYPGFTVSYNRDFHQPNWVAWELTGDEVRNIVTHRNSTTFAEDPDVEGCAKLTDYRGSGYDRGHMAPAADMKWKQEAMNSCFLLTNICPQTNALNAGAWNSLEEKCRQWAVRDSAILIVCGPVLSDRLTETIGDSGVPVPQRFFKVILAPYADPPRGIGFIMPNSNVQGGMQASAVSIDEVETATGFDFFSALPDDIENDVESQCNFPKWNKR